MSVQPAAPPDGAVVRTRPVFELSYQGVDLSDVRSLRLRIVLRDERTHEAAYVFDQRRLSSGWAQGEAGRAVYLPRRPIRDGSYTWSAWHWNGHEWVGGETSWRLGIDSVPPAEVEDLSLHYDRPGRRLQLSWTPVTLDRDGAPEFVRRYRIYRHGAPPFMRIAEREVARSETERLWLDDPEEAEPALVFYNVAAEDEAGNRAGQRFATEP